MKTLLVPVLGSIALLSASPALAEQGERALSFTASATTEVWRNVQGGLSTDTVALTMADATLGLDGTALGHKGFGGEISLVATNGQSLSAQIGDIQTASNIENDGALHLYQAWLRQALGQDASIKAGILDLNADFDTNDTASLFINSAHGVGPEISGSGLAGGPVWPLGTAGLVVQARPRPDLNLQFGVYNGIPRDLDHAHAFAALGHDSRDGLMAIGQADWTLVKDTRLAIGVWHNSARLTASDPRLSETVSGQTGAYAILEGAVPGLDQTRGWLRLGLVEPKASNLSQYFGAGLVRQGVFSGRPDDLLGLAIAHARLSSGSRQADAHLGLAETALELTYAIQLSDRLAIQPDLQYIIHPGGDRTLDDALVIGVRMAVQLP
jgi:porin